MDAELAVFAELQNGRRRLWMVLNESRGMSSRYSPGANLEVRMRRLVRVGCALWMSAVVSAAMCAGHGAMMAQDASDEVVPGMEDTCVELFGYLGCDATGMPKRPAGQLVVVHFAAVAVSPTKMTAGGSHGQNSQDAAESTALQYCRRNGASDCKVLTWGQNACVSLAVSFADKAYGFSVADNRDEAAVNAMAQCLGGRGKSCVTVAAPCAADDVRWSSPLPLPIGVQGGSVDPAMVGTWELFINPGRWIWRVASNGTYELHSEAMDATPSNAGTFTASNGKYTLHALTMPWDDTGTYKVQSPTVVVATGKLGTGTWRKIAGASSTSARPAVPVKQSGPPITVRK